MDSISVGRAKTKGLGLIRDLLFFCEAGVTRGVGVSAWAFSTQPFDEITVAEVLDCINGGVTVQP